MGLAVQKYIAGAVDILGAKFCAKRLIQYFPGVSIEDLSSRLRWAEINRRYGEIKVAIYCRCSTKDQDVTIQERLCREYCERHGHEIYKVYIDTMSGMADTRPAFSDMIQDMRNYRFNGIVVTKLDRIGRSLKHILNLFDEFAVLGVHFIATSQNIDTSSSIGKFQLQMLGAFAEFERNIISERTRESLQFAKNVGMRGRDKKPRKKRGVLRSRINIVSKSG